MNLSKHICTQCGFVYHQSQGFVDRNIAPGTPLDELKDWLCPGCGQTADKFIKIIQFDRDFNYNAWRSNSQAS